MTTTLTQVSNVFNLLSQLDSRILHYHFGWQWDINKEIDNNFDPGNKTGRLFPAVQMDVPDYFQTIEEPSYDGTKEEIKVLLYFYDEQDYNNNSSAKTTNLIEQWTNLKTIAEDFMANYLEAIGPKKYNIGFITNPRYTQRSNLHNDRLILWEVEFILTHIAPCTEFLRRIDLDLLPEILQLADLERITEPPPICYSIQFDGVNDYIEASGSSSFDFEIDEKFTFTFWHKDFGGAFKPLGTKIGGGKGYRFMKDTGGQLFVQLINSPSTYIYIRTATVLSGGGWNHYAITYNGNGDASGIEIYFNGVQQAITTVQNNFPVGGSMITAQNFIIGAQLPTLFVGGSSAQVRTWNIKLGSSAILFDYNGGEINEDITNQINLVGSPDINASTFDGLNWDFPDIAGKSIFTSINMEISDKVEDCP